MTEVRGSTPVFKRYSARYADFVRDPDDLEGGYSYVFNFIQVEAGSLFSVVAMAVTEPFNDSGFVDADPSLVTHGNRYVLYQGYIPSVVVISDSFQDPSIANALGGNGVFFTYSEHLAFIDIAISAPMVGDGTIGRIDVLAITV